MYAFDDCSILHSCKIIIPNAFKIYFSKDFKHRNYDKLLSLNNYLQAKSLTKYKFVPNNIQTNIIKVVTDMLKGYNVQMLGSTFKSFINILL
jgi:hypothetical protein